MDVQGGISRAHSGVKRRLDNQEMHPITKARKSSCSTGVHPFVTVEYRSSCTADLHVEKTGELVDSTVTSATVMDSAFTHILEHEVKDYGSKTSLTRPNQAIHRGGAEKHSPRKNLDMGSLKLELLNHKSTSPQTQSSPGVHNFMKMATRSNEELKEAPATAAGVPRCGSSPRVLQQRKTLDIRQYFLKQQKKPATPKQQQYTEKLSLQMRLEKILSEIPIPGPSPPEIALLPSTTCNDFLCILGLERVTGVIFQPDREFEPYLCLQCGKDTTPIWRCVESMLEKVLCLRCVNMNRKKSLQGEHAARLKAVLAQAGKPKERQKEAALTREADAENRPPCLNPITAAVVM